MAAGRPRAWPMAWSRWDFAYLVKSGMFRATVGQKPTIPVSDGMKNFMKSAVAWNLLGALRTGPRPPALPVIHQRSNSPTISMNGALIPSRKRMVSMPRQITAMLISQKAKKQIHGPVWELVNDGHRMRSIEKMA